MQQTSQSAKFMQIIIALLPTGGLVWWIAVEELKPAGPEALKVEVGDLRSALSEAARIIEQAQSGKLTVKFFQVELELLREQAETVRKNIAAETPPPGLEEKFAAAQKLAETGREAIGRLLPLWAQPQQMNDERANLDALFQQAVTLEKSLQQ